jgi:signal transduction histidine kinase
MFRQRPPTSRSFFFLMVGILLAIVCASAMSAWIVIEVRKEQQTVKDLMSGSPQITERVGTLPEELRWQLVFSILVLFVLLLAAVVLLFIFRAFVKSQESLGAVRLLSWNILSSINHGVITTDVNRVITSINACGEEFLSIDFDSVGHNIDEICQNGIPIGRMSQAVLDGEEPVSDEDFIHVTGDHVRHLLANCHLLKDAHGHVLGTVLHVRDVTERQLTEARMRRMERYMGLGTLAAGLHHEIKNPLSGLALHVQLLEEHFQGALDKDVAETLGVLKTEVTRIGAVLESFRSYVSLSQLNRSRVDLTRLIEHTAQLVRPQAQQSNVKIELDLPDQELTPVLVDEAKFEQVLLNVALNALDAMPGGGRLSLRLTSDETNIRIEVADTGPGISESVRARIFDPYFTTKSDGSGMGLALTEKIVQQHGGGISVETSCEGTVFQLKLPLDEVS